MINESNGLFMLENSEDLKCGKIPHYIYSVLLHHKCCCRPNVLLAFLPLLLSMFVYFHWSFLPSFLSHLLSCLFYPFSSVCFFLQNFFVGSSSFISSFCPSFVLLFACCFLSYVLLCFHPPFLPSFFWSCLYIVSSLQPSFLSTVPFSFSSFFLSMVFQVLRSSKIIIVLFVTISQSDITAFQKWTNKLCPYNFNLIS